MSLGKLVLFHNDDDSEAREEISLWKDHRGGDNEKGLAVTRDGFAVPPVGRV
jgi:hypothetical protein